MRWWSASTIGSLLVAVAASVVAAAPPAGEVTGVVKDAFERPLAAARVRLETSDGRVTDRVTADDQGRFTFTGVAPGRYTVVAEGEGFEPMTASATVTDAERLTPSSSPWLAASRSTSRVRPAGPEEDRIKVPPVASARRTYEISSRRSRPARRREQPADPGAAPGAGRHAGLLERGRHSRARQMGNVQYRINGIALPEGATLFGQGGGLSPRLASSVDACLPARSPPSTALRTTGIFDIQTKSGAFEPGGYVGHVRRQPRLGSSRAWSIGGSVGRLNYFVTADYLQNSIGISPATPNGAIHDDTQQGHGFGYFESSWTPPARSARSPARFVGHFQIPNSPGVDAGVHRQRDLGVRFHEARREPARAELFPGPVLFQEVEGISSFQAARSRATADVLPSRPARRSALQRHRASGSTGAASRPATDRRQLRPHPEPHAPRRRLLGARSVTSVQTTSSVLPADRRRARPSDEPFNIFDSHGKTGYTYSVYLQDAWKVLPTVTSTAACASTCSTAFTQREAAQPAPQRGVAARRRADRACGLRALLHAAAARPVVNNGAHRRARRHHRGARVTDQRPGARRARPLLRRRLHAAAPAGLKFGLDAYYKIATTCSTRASSARRLPDPVQLPARRSTYGVELTASYAAGGFTGYGNLAAAQQWAKGIASAQALFSAEDLAYIHEHYIVTDHSQLITASAGALLPLARDALEPRLPGRQRPPAHVAHPNDASNPPYQQLNLGHPQRFTLPAIGPMEARFDVINVLGKDYVLRDGTGVGIFASQFGPPRGFFAGVKKEF